MKLNELKNIIREEIMAALAENAPAKERETKERETKERETKEKEKSREIGNPTIPKKSPTPAKASTSLKEEEKELAKKIADRFLKLKK
jgi:hypothetical protein